MDPQDPPEGARGTLFVPDTPKAPAVTTADSSTFAHSYQPDAETQPAELSFGLSYADDILGPRTLSFPVKSAHPPLIPTRPRAVPSAATPADDPDISHIDSSQLSPASQQSPRTRLDEDQTSFSPQAGDFSQSQVPTMASFGVPAAWEHVSELSEVQEEVSGQQEAMQSMERELKALGGGPPPLPASYDQDVDELDDSIQDPDISTLPAAASAPVLPRLPSQTLGTSLLDGSNGPSSSPYVANLLQSRLPRKKTPFELVSAAPDSSASVPAASLKAEIELEPQSSADDFSTSLLVRPQRETTGSVVEEEEGEEGDLSAMDLEGDAGPVTSTPAFFGAAPPRPLSPPPTIKKSSLSEEVEQSVVKEEEDDEEAEETGMDVEEAEGALEQSLDEGGEKDMTMDDDEKEGDDDADTTFPRPTVEQTLDMDIDEPDSTIHHSQPPSLHESQPASCNDSSEGHSYNLLPAATEVPSLASPQSQRSQSQSQSQSQSLLDSGPPAPRQPSPPPRAATPIFGLGEGLQSPDQSRAEGADESQSQSQSQRQEDTSRRLSDIADLQSSYDQPEPSQVLPQDLEATQQVYDSDRQTAEPSSGQSMQPPSRNLPPFVYNTGANEPSTRHSFPPPGRELRRVVPPDSSIPREASSTSLDSSQSVPLNLSNCQLLFAPETQAETQAETKEQESLEVPLAAQAADDLDESLEIPLATLASSKSALLASNEQPKLVVSSNGQVSDSEGPTPDQAQRTAPPAKSQAEIISDAAAVVEQMIVDDSFDVHGDFGGGGEEEQEKSSDEEAVEVEVSKSKGKGKAKATPALKPALKKSKITVGRSAKSKGKGRASSEPPTDSPDQLDLFQKSDVGARMEEDEEEQHLFETNYEEMPTTSNAKHRSPGRGRTSVESTASVASTSAGTSVGTSRKGSKRRVGERPVVEIEAPSKRRRTTSAQAKNPRGKASPGKPPAKRASARDRKISLATDQSASPEPPTKRRPARSRKASVASSRSVSLDGGPVAGPSTVRFKSTDDVVMADGRRTSEPSYAPKSSAKRSTTSKLPSTAPFTRIFGMWRDDQWFYPGTIVGIVNGDLKVVFDDESKADLKYAEARRCELERGDFVRYRGDEIETETQMVMLSDDVRVLRVERGTTGEDQTGELARSDIIVATKPEVAIQDQTGVEKKERLTFDSICIPENRSAQLDNRKLTLKDIAALEGRAPRAAKPLSLCAVPSKPTYAPLVVNRRTKGIFDSMGFLVTRAPDSYATPGRRSTNKAPNADDIATEKAAYVRLLEASGATVFEVENLYKIEMDAERSLSLSFPTDAFRGLDHVLLLADRPSTTHKFLTALALGIPCVSRDFVKTSIERNARQDWRPFTTAASSTTFVIGGQLRAVAKDSFDLASIEESYNEGGLFSSLSILIVTPKKGKSTAEYDSHVLTLRSIFAAAGADKVDFVLTPDAASTGAGYDYVLLEDTHAVTDALAEHEGISNVEWLKQSLIAGEVLPAKRFAAPE